MGARLTETQIEDILMDMQEALEYLREKEVYMDWMGLEDIREVAGVYKLGNLSRTVEEEKITVRDNLLSLRSKLFEL